MARNNIKAIGKKIKVLRIKKGWSLRDMQQTTGLNYSTLSCIERSGSTTPRSAKKIADALETEFDEVFEIEI